ncbi:hypothetical protein IU487_22695 [Nocardia puris]|uniref:hypothetical protein n=1 Tax=Nocardia puris TaxID=208602 RepID=UPI001895102F|nr:hypothetical protein [Nocardia puris]MBF6213829.1 hypothetical protein [Nocardia puris]
MTLLLGVAVLLAAFLLAVALLPDISEDDRESFGEMKRRLDHAAPRPPRMTVTAARLACRVHRECDPARCTHLRMARTVLLFSNRGSAQRRTGRAEGAR